jgi:hypothetical protein
MTDKELKEKAKEYFTPDIEVKGIHNVNHKPHPYTIGAQHIQRYRLNTSIGCAGYVDQRGNYSNKSKPGFTKCGLSLEEHTSDKAIFLSFNKDMTANEVEEKLKIFIDLYPKEFNGFVFVKSEFKIIEK